MAGFGKILAEVSINLQKSAAHKAPPCPLCGVRMEDDGVAYFCYAVIQEHRAWLDSRHDAAREYHRRGGMVFWSDLEVEARARHLNWDSTLQSAILAVAEAPDGGLVYFWAVRGGGGQTNFRVDKHAEGWVPGSEDWRWAEWTGREDESG